MLKLKPYLIKKNIISGVFFCFFALFSFCQQQSTDQANFWKNVRFGGGVGLNFGDGFFSGSISPNAVYRINSYVATGVGLNAIYSRQRDVFRSTVLGGSIIGLFNPIRDIQLSTEFEQLHVNRKFEEDFITNADDNYWYPALFLGAGYRSNNVTFGIRYDVLYDRERSIYNEAWMPFVRFFF